MSVLCMRTFLRMYHPFHGRKRSDHFLGLVDGIPGTIATGWRVSPLVRPIIRPTTSLYSLLHINISGQPLPKRRAGRRASYPG